MGVAKVKWNTARSANRSYRVQHQGRTRPFSIEPRVSSHAANTSRKYTLYLCHPPDPANVHTPNPSPHSRSPPPFSSSLRYLRTTTRLHVYLPALELRNDTGVFSVDVSFWLLLREDMETVVWMSAGCASRGNFEALEGDGCWRRI